MTFTTIVTIIKIILCFVELIIIIWLLKEIKKLLDK